jgi:hypothetical protein
MPPSVTLTSMVAVSAKEKPQELSGCDPGMGNFGIRWINPIFEITHTR